MSSHAFTLINYPPSITTEKVRWLLYHYGIAVTERRMTLSPGFLFTVLRYFPRFRRSPPYAIDAAAGLYFRRPGDVLDYFDTRVQPERRLKIDEGGFAPGEAAQLTRANDLIGGHIRPWAYSYITPEKRLFLQSISAGVPNSQKRFARLVYPLIAFFTRNVLSPTSKALPGHFKALQEGFDLMDVLLADGRTYLAQNRLSFLDINFCVQAAPCVMPAQYGGGGILPALSDLPEAMRAPVALFRDRPTGRYILDIYERHRLTENEP